MNSEYLASQVVQMFRLEIKAPALVKAEGAGRIPLAARRMRGKVPSRFWRLDQLPEIGKTFGKLRPPKETEVIASYMPKGGIGKTAWTYNFARTLALHGIKTLVIGADFQCSISKSFGAQYGDASEMPMSLYDAIVNKVPINELITESDIPTLFYIPESTELTILDRHLIPKNRREEILNGLLKPLKKQFQVILIDCPPQWNELVTNALVAADSIICPVSADGESFHSFKIFMNELKNFTETMKKEFKLIKFIPNQVNVRNKYTTSFQRKFVDDYPEIFTSSFIRDSVVVKESGSKLKSVIEYAPDSFSAEDFYNAVFEVWTDLLEEEEA